MAIEHGHCPACEAANPLEVHAMLSEHVAKTYATYHPSAVAYQCPHHPGRIWHVSIPGQTTEYPVGERDG
jgi:hypothetical protein